MLDYAATFDLIVFRHDRWTFNTVKAAVAASGIKKSMRALRSKPGFTNYYSNVGDICSDLHRQLGPAHLFVTIAPSELEFLYVTERGYLVSKSISSRTWSMR